MGVLRDRVVLVLLVLVLAGCALSVGLAVTRADAGAVLTPPAPVEPGGPAYEPADLAGPGGDALDAAVRALPLVLGYDHRDLDAAAEAATATMTPRYAERFREAFDERVRPFARRRAAVAEGAVRGAGLVRASDEAAVCLAYVDQLLVRARGLRGGETEVLGRSRLRVSMVLRDGAWLVDGLAAV